MRIRHSEFAIFQKTSRNIRKRRNSGIKARNKELTHIANIVSG